MPTIRHRARAGNWGQALEFIRCVCLGSELVDLDGAATGRGSSRVGRQEATWTLLTPFPMYQVVAPFCIDPSSVASFYVDCTDSRQDPAEGWEFAAKMPFATEELILGGQCGQGSVVVISIRLKTAQRKGASRWGVQLAFWLPPLDHLVRRACGPSL